jgi:hypothetical protein
VATHAGIQICMQATKGGYNSNCDTCRRLWSEARFCKARMVAVAVAAAAAAARELKELDF